MKILHFADVHSRDKDIEEVVKCLNFIVETAEKEKVELIVIAGDIFHSQELKLDSLSAKLAIKTVSRLADIAPVAIVLGTASHDGKAPEILSFARGNYDVHVSSMPEQIFLYQGCFYDHMVGNCKPEAVISLCPPPHKQFFQSASGIAQVDQEIGAAMSGLFAGWGAMAAQYDAPHILVGHFSAFGAKLSSGQARTGMDIEISRDQMMLAQPLLIMLGHIHMPQQLGDRCFYSSSIYAENWGETHDHGFYIHEAVDDPLPGLDGYVVSSIFHETPCKKLVRLQADLRDRTTADFMDDACDADISHGVVRIDFTAWQDEAAAINKAAIVETLTELGAVSVDIRITPVPRVTVRAASVLSAERLRDKIERRAELVEEELDRAIGDLADQLEDMPINQLLEMVAGGRG